MFSCWWLRDHFTAEFLMSSRWCIISGMIIDRTLLWFTEFFPCKGRKTGWEKASTFCGLRVRQSSFPCAGKSSSLK